MEWLRFYVSTLDNPKVQGLPGGLFKAWVNCLCLARLNDGVLPSVDVIAFRLRCTTRQAEQWRDDLVQRKLADPTPDGAYRMHDWDQHQYVSDGSTERVRKHRRIRREHADANRFCPQVEPTRPLLSRESAANSEIAPTPGGLADHATNGLTGTGNVTVASPERFRKRYSNVLDTEQIQIQTQTQIRSGAPPRAEVRPIRLERSVTHARAADLDGQTSQRFEELWKRWPRKEQRDRAFQDWLSFVTTDNEAGVIACADRYLSSDEVDRGVVKQLFNWLEQQHRDGWTGEWPKKAEESRWK